MDILFCSITPTNLGQLSNLIWNLLVLTFSKHPLHVQFDQVLAEIFEVKDKWLESFISMVIDLTERKIIEIWIFCAKSFWTNLRRNKVVWAAHLPLTLLTKCTFHNVPCLCTGFRGIGQLCTLQSLDVGQLITIQYLVTYLGQPIRTLKASNLMGRYDIRVGRYFWKWVWMEPYERFYIYIWSAVQK